MTPKPDSFSLHSLDLEQFRIRGKSRQARRQARAALPMIVDGEGYIGGRIPMRWFNKLGGLSGKSVTLGVLLWRWAALDRGNARLAVRATEARAAGVSRNTMYRSLDALEGAGLIAVQRHRGRCAVVQILDPDGLPPVAVEVE